MIFCCVFRTSVFEMQTCACGTQTRYEYWCIYTACFSTAPKTVFGIQTLTKTNWNYQETHFYLTALTNFIPVQWTRNIQDFNWSRTIWRATVHLQKSKLVSVSTNSGADHRSGKSESSCAIFSWFSSGRTVSLCVCGGGEGRWEKNHKRRVTTGYASIT